MSLLKFLSLAVLALWLGGLAVLGTIAAPVIFAVLEARDPVGGRALAGEVFGAVFQRFQYAAWALGGVALVLLAVRIVLGPRPRRTAVQLSLVAAMLAASLYTGLFAAPRIDVIRRETAGGVSALPLVDTRRVEFGRLHGLSNGLMALTLLAGLAVLWIETKDGQ